MRAKGSPSGLNQTSANFSPLYFKAAHCFEGGCSEKFTPLLSPLRTNYGCSSRLKNVAMSCPAAMHTVASPSGFQIEHLDALIDEATSLALLGAHEAGITVTMTIAAGLDRVLVDL